MWFIKNWRLVLGIIGIIGIIGIAGYIYHKGGEDREDKIESETVKETLVTKERLDEIRNTPIDTDDVIKRLRSGSF